MNESNGDIVFDSSRNRMNGNITNLTWEDNGLRNDETGYITVDLSGLGGSIQSLGSMATSIRPDTDWDTDNDNYMIFSELPAANNEISIFKQDNPDLNLKLIYGTKEVFVDPIGWDAKELHSLAFTFVGNGALKIYLDGVERASDTASNNPNQAVPIHNISRGSGGGAQYDGTMYYAYRWNRVIAPSETMWIHREPYAMFQQESRVQLFSVGAPPAGNAPTGALWGPLGGPLRGPIQ